MQSLSLNGVIGKNVHGELDAEPQVVGRGLLAVVQGSVRTGNLVGTTRGEGGGKGNEFQGKSIQASM